MPFQWDEPQDSAFNALRASLSLPPILIHPNFNKPFLLFTDASNVSIGAILAQQDKNKVDHPISYYSKTLSKAERNYSVTESKCLAVLPSIKHFRPFLYGTHFTIITNHSSLNWLQQMKDPDGRLTHWALFLQAYNFSIVHRAGAIHQNANGLSRLPMISLLAPEEDQIYELLGQPNLWEREPEKIQKLLAKLSKDTQISNGHLYKLVHEKWLPYVCPSSRVKAVMEGHADRSWGC